LVVILQEYITMHGPMNIRVRPMLTGHKSPFRPDENLQFK